MSIEQRIAGTVLGAAIGDAMGHPTEFVGSFEEIRSKWPPDGVTGFELYWTRDGRRFAPYTDDTQMAEVVLRTLVRSRRDDLDVDATMRLMADGFVQWARDPQGGHRAPGNACLAGCRQLAAGVPWSEAGGATAGGCGSVMRAYPFGVVFRGDVDKARKWAIEHSKLTHRDPIALAACAAMAVATALVPGGVETNLVLQSMIEAAATQSAGTAEMIERAVAEANAGVPPEVTLERLEAWAAHEAIAAAA
jgi:ADP-ribosylglycohydrolase